MADPATRASSGGDELLWVRWLCLALGAFVAGVFSLRIMMSASAHATAYLACLSFGVLVGATELIGRYRDKPVAPLETVPGLIYLGVNGTVSLGAFWLLDTGQIPELPILAGMGTTLNKVLLAGFGSMALFRSRLFTVRVKDADIAIGPAVALEVILASCDRACDRLRAGPRARDVKNAMAGVSFTRARETLVQHCLALMQNLSSEETAAISQRVSTLEGSRMSDDVKAYNLGLILMNYVGFDVLDKAVRALDTAITGPPVDEPPIFGRAAELKQSDMGPLISHCAAFDPLDREALAEANRARWTSYPAVLTNETDQVVVTLSRLRRFFGPATVSRAIDTMVLARSSAVLGTGGTTAPLSGQAQSGAQPPAPPPPPRTAAAGAVPPRGP